MWRALLLLLMAIPTVATNAVYLANTAQGGGTGVDCADALIYTYFNTVGNWSATPSGILIGPDTTVHICNTITGLAGATGLTFQGSGTVGHPVILFFEANAGMSAPYWANAIVSNSQTNFVIDGGSNGLIQNTANGTFLANQNTNSTGIVVTAGATNVEIKNINCANIYVHVAAQADGAGGGQCISVVGVLSGLKVHDNTLHDSRHNLYVAYDGSSSNIDIYNNHSYNTTWGIFVGDDNNGSAVSNVYIHGNDIHDFAMWFDTGFLNHYDGIFIQDTNTGSTFAHLWIYNNYLHGLMDTNGTGYIYLSDSAVGMSDMNIFNNECSHLALTNSGSPEACFVIGFSSQGVSIYNNTLQGIRQTTPQHLIRVRNGTNLVTAIENNIFVTGGSIMDIYTGSTVSVSNFNVFGGTNVFTFGTACKCPWYFDFPDGTKIQSLASWTSVTGGLDANSFSGNAGMNYLNLPVAGSPAITIGTNLYTFAGCSSPVLPGLGALCFDKPLTVGVGAPLTGPNARPASGPWIAGAYSSIGTSGSVSQAQATVHTGSAIQ